MSGTLVVTHTEGFLGCFTVNPDGSMRQRALIDVGTEPPSPQALAALGMSLAGEYGWQLNGVKPELVEHPRLPAVKKALKKGVAALPAPAAEAVRNARSLGQKNRKQYPPAAVKVALIVKCLRQYPGSSIGQILERSNQPNDAGHQSNWSHTIKAMLQDGSLYRTGKGHSTDPFKYYLTSMREPE